MKIQVNTNAATSRTQEAFEQAVNDIKANAAKGTDTTELLIDNDISGDVRRMLEKEVEGINFLTVMSKPNQFTGRMDYFSGRTEGSKRYYKVKI